MKRLLLVGVVIVLIGVAWFAATHKTPNVQNEILTDTHIVLTEKGYVPSDVTIRRGSTVTFSTELEKVHWPASNIHPTHDVYPEFDPLRPLDPEEEWSFTFVRTGDFNFHDHIRAYYLGTIHVVD